MLMCDDGKPLPMQKEANRKPVMVNEGKKVGNPFSKVEMKLKMLMMRLLILRRVKVRIMLVYMRMKILLYMTLVTQCL